MHPVRAESVQAPLLQACGLTLVAADLLSRTVALPIELPVGAVMALIGAPVFVWFLARGER